MFQIGDVIRSIPTGMVFDVGWEGVIVSSREQSDEIYFEVKYFNPEAADAIFLLSSEMEKLSDS